MRITKREANIILAAFYKADLHDETSMQSVELSHIDGSTTIMEGHKRSHAMDRRSLRLRAKLAEKIRAAFHERS